MAVGLMAVGRAAEARQGDEMDDFSLGSFVGAFAGALIATPFWLRALMRQIKKLQSCAHCHKGCPTIQTIEFGNEVNK
jgi:hypothetical protein